MSENTKKNTVLICDDDSLIHLAIKEALKDQFIIHSAYNGDEALSLVKRHPIDVVLLDIRMRSDDEGLRYIKRLLEVDPDLAVIMNSGVVDFRSVREAMRLGALDYVAKDCLPEELAHSLARVLDRRDLLKREQQHSFEASSIQSQHVLIGQSSHIVSLRKDILKLRNSSASVLIYGETGTGKEVVARQLRSVLPNGSLAPFIAIDSATIQSSTAESILFGHQKGAFTGADKITKGVFEEANGGTVYFDEIANMPLEIQAKLLRVLQEKEVTRLGSSKTIPLEFRVICATNNDLEQMSIRGEFKHDLLQRINVIPIYLAPLRERTEDIPLLVDFFLKKHSKALQPGLVFTDEAMAVLKGYPWQGNVRELNNLIAYLVTMTDGDVVDIAHLPPKFRHSMNSSQAAGENSSFYEKVLEYEKILLTKEFQKHDGKITKLAALLGMDRSHLYKKLKEHGIFNPSKA